MRSIAEREFLAQPTGTGKIFWPSSRSISKGSRIGGWGVILRYKGVEKELSGFNPDTTNNRMELQAAIEGIKVLKRSVKVDLYTDSQYVRNGITKWLLSWKQNNWRLSDRSPVKNKDLWEELDALVQTHHISWHWVKGHSGHPENERADALAVQAIKDSLSRF
jgi:ribonuclease HI